jgi:hypothetical protein
MVKESGLPLCGDLASGCHWSTAFKIFNPAKKNRGLRGPCVFSIFLIRRPILLKNMAAVCEGPNPGHGNPRQSLPHRLEPMDVGDSTLESRSRCFLP